MIKLNLFAISGLLIVIIYLPLSLFIFLKGKPNAAKLYALHLFVTSGWGLTEFIIGINSDLHLAPIIWRIALSFVIFIPVFFTHAVVLITGNRIRWLIYLAYVQAIFYLVMNFSGKLALGYNWMFNSMYYLQGTKIHLSWFISWEMLVIIAHSLLIQDYMRSYPLKKKEILTLLYGLPLGFVGGTTNFLAAYNINIYPFGNIFIPIYAIFITYSIFKHHILDIEIVLKKSIAYSIAIALLSISYLLIVVILEKSLQQYFHYQSIAISITAAFGVGLIFFPLRNEIQNLIDRIFFKGTQTEIANQNELLKQELARTERLKVAATLASGIVHEVRNPLAILKTHSEFLPQKINEPGYLQNYTKMTASEIDRITDLMQGLLDFAKPAPLSFRNVNIHQLIDESLNLIHNKLNKTYISVVKEYFNDTQLNLSVDAKQMKQVLLNIFLNAMDAMPSGGKLTITTQLKENQSIFEIYINDTGCGIPSKDLPHIFDPFFSQKKHGTGLGLSISHGIISEHKGRIRVTSETSKGTTFIIELPITAKGVKHD